MSDERVLHVWDGYEYSSWTYDPETQDIQVSNDCGSEGSLIDLRYVLTQFGITLEDCKRALEAEDEG